MTASPSRRPGLAGARGIPDIVADLRATFHSGRTRPIEWRLAQLEAIARMLAERETDFTSAMAVDLGRPRVDAWLADLAPPAAEARFAHRKLRSWVRSRRVRVPSGLWPARAWYRYEPLGVVLIVAPWNYPIQLILSPLVGAIAAGNCAILKPSEQAPACSALLAELVPSYLDPEAVAVVEGGADETLTLLDQALDHCLFTGSPGVGKAVMTAAAKHLTPVTLELGGKSPAIVAADANLRVAARRIAWAKQLNSGQTCVAPDYVLVERSVREAFMAELDKAMTAFARAPRLPVVDARHAARLADLIGGAGGRVRRGGRVDIDDKMAELTVVLDPDPDSALLRDEIFGPVLPIVTVDTLDDAIAHVQQGPKPLAVYLFSEGYRSEQRVLDELSNGATVVNHLMYHLAVSGLPFGGVGNSGTGSYHGQWGFETFSHRKAVLRKPTWFDLPVAYPPYSKIKERVLRKML